MVTRKRPASGRKNTPAAKVPATKPDACNRPADADERDSNEENTQPPTQMNARAGWSSGCFLDSSGKEFVKHAFTQVMMQRGIVRQQEAKEAGDDTAMSIFRDISGNTSGSLAALVDFIADVNHNIRFLELEIRRMLFPAERAWYVALVNTTEDVPSKLLVATPREPSFDLYTHHELAFFKALVEAIATSDESVQAGVPLLKASAALHLPYTISGASQGGSQGLSAGKVLSLAEKQNTMIRLTQDGWLARSPDGTAGILGPRTLMALRPWVCSLDLSEETRQEWDRTL